MKEPKSKSSLAPTLIGKRRSGSSSNHESTRGQKLHGVSKNVLTGKGKENVSSKAKSEKHNEKSIHEDRINRKFRDHPHNEERIRKTKTDGDKKKKPSTGKTKDKHLEAEITRLRGELDVCHADSTSQKKSVREVGERITKAVGALDKVRRLHSVTVDFPTVDAVPEPKRAELDEQKQTALKTSFNNWRKGRRTESSAVRWRQEWPKVLELERSIIKLSKHLENERGKKRTFITQAEASFRDNSKLEEQVKQQNEQLMELQKERTDLEGRVAKKPTELLLEAVTRRLGGARKELDDLEKNLDRLACERARSSLEKEQRLLLQHKIETRTGEVSKLEEILQLGGGGQLETVFSEMVKYYVDAIDDRTITLIKTASSTEIRAQRKLKKKDVSVADAEKTSADKGRELIELYDQKQQIEERLKQTQEDLNQTKTEVEKLRAKSQSLNQVVEEKEGEARKLREELQSSERKVRKLSRTAKQAKHNRHASPEDRHVALDPKDEETKLKHERQSELENKLQQLTNDIEAQTRQLNGLHNEHQEKKKKMAAEKRKELDEAKRVENQKRMEIQRLEDQLRDLAVEIEDARGQLTELRTEKCEIVQEVQENKTKLGNLRKSNIQKETQIRIGEQNLTQLELTKKRLANDIDVAKAELEELRAEKGRLANEVQESNAKLADLEKSEKQSQIKITSRSKELTGLQQTKQKLTAEIQMNESELERIEQELSMASGNLARLQSESEELRKSKTQVSNPKTKKIEADAKAHLSHAEERLEQLVTRDDESGISLIRQLEAKLRMPVKERRHTQQLNQASECLRQISSVGKSAVSTDHERTLAVCQTLDRLTQAMTILGDLESSTCEEDWNLVKKLLSDIMEVYRGPELNLRDTFRTHKELLDRHFGSRGQSREEIDRRWESALAGVEGRYTECTQRAESPVRAAITKQKRQESLFNESDDDEMGEASDESDDDQMGEVSNELPPQITALKGKKRQRRPPNEEQLLRALEDNSAYNKISTRNSASSKKGSSKKGTGPKRSIPQNLAAKATARSAPKKAQKPATGERRSSRQTRPPSRLIDEIKG